MRQRCEKAADALAAAGCLTDLTLEKLGCREPGELQVTDCGIEEHSLGNQAYDLTPGDLYALRFGAQLHKIERVVKRRLLRVDEIHRHLRLAVHFQAEPFYVAETARRAAHRFGDVLRDLQVRGGSKVDVVGGEKRTGADGNRAAGGVDLLRGGVRLWDRVFGELLAQPLDLSTPVLIEA